MENSCADDCLCTSANTKPSTEMKFNLSKLRDDASKVMHQMRSYHILTDVKLSVGREVLHAHKIVLASASSYFKVREVAKAMFTSGLSESKMSTIRLLGVCPGVMATLLYFMYSGRLTITEKNVCHLMSAASMYQIPHVEDACCLFLKNQLDPTNVIGIAKFAQVHNCNELHGNAIKFLENNFAEVSKGEEFLDLEASQILCLTQNDALSVPDEETVFNAMVRWVEHDPSVRRDKFDTILKFIRCHYLPPSFLSKQLSSSKLIKSMPACQEYLSNIFQDLHLHKPPEGSMRCPPKAESLFHVIGGYSQFFSSEELHCYDTDSGDWKRLQGLPCGRSGLGAGFVRGGLYAVAGRVINKNGAREDTKTLSLYTADGEWINCAPLMVARNRLGVGVVDGLLYAVGGMSGPTILSSVERYDPRSNSWENVADMKYKRGGLCCVVLNRLLYAIGGCNDSFSRLAYVECYNPDLNEWKTVAPLLRPRSGAGAAAAGNRVYVIGGHAGNGPLKTVEMYNPDTNEWSFVSPMNSRRSAAAVARKGNFIYAMGGYDGERILSSVEVYDIEKDTWTEGTPMPFIRSGHAVAVPTCHLMNPCPHPETINPSANVPSFVDYSGL